MNVFCGRSDASSTCGYYYDQATSRVFIVWSERLSINESGSKVDCNSCVKGT